MKTSVSVIYAKVTTCTCSGAGKQDSVCEAQL